MLSIPEWPHWRRSILDLINNLYQVYAGENWWSILVPRTTSPIFNQFTSGILHSVLHLRIYDIKHSYEFVCYIGFFLSQPKVGKFVFVRFVFIGNGQTYFNFQYIYLKFLHYVLYLMKYFILKELLKICFRSKHSKAKTWIYF